MSHVNATRGEWWWILINWVKVTLKFTLEFTAYRDVMNGMFHWLLNYFIDLNESLLPEMHVKTILDKILENVRCFNLEVIVSRTKCEGLNDFIFQSSRLSLLWQLAPICWCFMSISHSTWSFVLKNLLSRNHKLL